MDTSAATVPPTGRRVPIRHKGQVHDAFVPHPLPPDLELDEELWRALSDADRALAELAGWGRDMANPRLFIRPFMRQEAVSSSRIEGTQADLTDLYAFEAGQMSFADLVDRSASRTGAPQDVLEVHNYVRAAEHGLERLGELPLSKRLFRELHRQLMQGVRGGHRRPGEFRKIQNWIGATRETPLSEAYYIPPPVAEMHEALDDLESYLNAPGRYPPLIRVALSHYQFEAIHPFIDGNGRVGRLLISLQLVHWGLLPLPLLYLSAYFERYRDRYISSLRAISDEGAWHGWLLFFLQGVKERSNRSIQTAEALRELKDTWRDRILEPSRTSTSALTLMEHLFERPVLSVPQARDLLGLTYNAARYNVRKLVDLEILQEFPVDSHPTLYYSPRILRIITRSTEETSGESSENAARPGG